MKFFAFLLVALASLVTSNSAHAFTECSFTVERIWRPFNVKEIYVCFDPTGCIFSTYTAPLSAEDAEIRNHFLSMAMTAFTAGKKLRVRFPENGATCSPYTANRSDIDGVWLID